MAVTMCVATFGCVAADAPSGARQYRPAATLPRLLSTDAALLDVGRVIDFDVDGEHLFLLETFDRLSEYARDAHGYHVVRTIGNSGDGPGEFRNATSVSVTAGAIVVAEQGRLHFFTRAGEHAVTKGYDLPCAMPRPAVAATANGLYLHGDCFHMAYVTDTVVATLFWSADTAQFQRVAREVRFTRDGSVGNAFSLAPAFATGLDEHLFGVGTTNCVWRVSDAALPPRAHTQCPVATSSYRADPPDELRAELRRGGTRGMKLEWPDPLPLFAARLPVASGTLLVRPFHADSVVLQLAAPLGTDIAVAPLHSLVGCKAAGCLWVVEHAEGAAVHFISRSELDALAHAQAGG